MAGGVSAEWRVFVSHTSELRKFPAGRSYVDAVEQAIRACGHVSVDMADFPAVDLPPARVCDERVRSCDVYVGVLGTRYGSRVRDREVLSYTELEFGVATEAGLERLAFELDTDAEDVGIPAKWLIDWEFGPQQEEFRRRVRDSGLVMQKFSSPAELGQLVERSLRELAERRRKAASADLGGAAGSQWRPDMKLRPRKYLEQLAESYQWLELQGIREAGSLRIELEKVYVALKAEPESEYDLGHLANLHSLEVREAADGTSLDLIDPAQREALDAENVRRTYQPRRDEARRASAKVQTIADAFRLYQRMVLLGGPGSGKTTLGHWLALQLARGLLRQLPLEVEPEDEPALPDIVRAHVPAGTTQPFSASHFAPLVPLDKTITITIDVTPARGTLALFGVPVTAGQALKVEQLDRLTFTPTENECGHGYAHLEFRAGGETAPAVRGALVIDVGTHVMVPRSQVDPDPRGPDGTGPLVDLGPARVPIFLRLAHFARELAERERTQRPTISLEEYLGRDPESCGRADGCTPDNRNALLRHFLESGQAVVILDGLDELPEANRRTVSLYIQDLIEKATKPNMTDRSAEPDVADESPVPWRAGGNQVIVTSRYVGYKLMPIRGGCAHFGIQAMQRPAVEHFARAWTAAVNAELDAAVHGQIAAEALIAEIYDDSRPSIRDLATNPLLVTILATVYWADGRLPDQRAGVYDRVVENLLRIWLNRPECQAHDLQRDELLAALEPLAADMEDTMEGNGLISLDRIGELIKAPLARMRRANPDDRSFKPVLDALLTTIRKHVGLLAEHSAGNYAFFHRTFQEFLAARYLLSDRENAAARIVERLDHPQWREPLLLALGLAMISPEWGGPQTRTQLLTDVLAGDDRDPLIPKAAMLLVNALPDLKDVPRPVIGRVVRQLLRCYAFSQDQSQAVGLRDGICEAFLRLRDGPQADVVAVAIAEAIRWPPADRDYSAAAAGVLLRIDWFTTEMVDALLHAAHRDQCALRWPVRWALLAALGQPASDLPWARPAPVLSTSRLVATHLPMRRLLESSPELAAFVRGDPDWLWLLIALFGGLGNAEVREQVQAHQRKRLRELRSAPDDPGWEAAGPPPPVPPIEFCPGNIVHDLADTGLSRVIQRHLRLRKPASELADTFRHAWQCGTDPAGNAEALVGLAALGEDVIPLLRGALAEGDQQPAARAALARFDWLRSLLQEPLLRSTETAARTLPEEAPEQHQLDLLRIVIESRVASGGGPLPVSDMIPSHRFVNAKTAMVRDALAAEYWAAMFSGLSGNRTDSTVVADVGQWSPDRLARGWPELSQARNLLARLRLPWPQAFLPPRCETPVQRYLAMLDALAWAPPEHEYLAGHLLGQCRPLLDDHPALIWETLATCLARGRQLTVGYLTGATGDRTLDSAVGSLAAGLASACSGQSLEQAGAESLRRVLNDIVHWRVADADEAAEPDMQLSIPILRQASRITDPYLRFRALWHLLATIGGELVGSLWLDILGLPKQMADYHDRARALEWIIMQTIPGRKRHLSVGRVFDLDELASICSRIEDPENRARAQCRLALLAPERLEDLLSAAAGSVDEIADPYQKAAAICDIRFAWGGVPGLDQALNAIADGFPDSWLRDKAHGRYSRLVAAYRPHYGAGALAWRLTPESAPLGTASHRLSYPTGHLAWGVLYLNATAAAAGELEAASTGSRADWDLLLGSQWRAGVDGLIESAGDGGLRITTREASVLNTVVQSGRTEVLEPLWAYLDSPDAGAMPITARWATADPVVERWKALVQAEAGLLPPENVARVVELMASPADRLRLRAALALHGRTPLSGNRNRRWSVARIGAEALEAIAWHASRTEYPPAVHSPLQWVEHDIHHDDGEALGRWLSAAEGSDSAVEWILSHIESIDAELVPQLLQAVPAASAALQRTLLTALARLAHGTTALTGLMEPVRLAVAAIPLAVRRKVQVVPYGAVTYLEIAARVTAEHGEGSRLEAARWMLEESMLWLDDGWVSSDRICLAGLHQLGGGLYISIGTGGYWEKANEAAASIAENEDALRLLMSWVESSSLTEGTDGPVSHLLSATAALAQASPSAFTTLADPDIWESILTDWAQTADHWATRLAAVQLLGLLRRVTDRIAAALRSAMGDVSFVQQAAYATVGGFRRMKGDIIPDLLSLLDDPSASVVASTARLLMSLAQGEGVTADRRRILRGLQDAVARSPRNDPVYLMEDLQDEGIVLIQFVDRLDRLLYRAIFEVSGL